MQKNNYESKSDLIMEFRDMEYESAVQEDMKEMNIEKQKE